MRPDPKTADNQPKCRQCGFWLEHGDNVSDADNPAGLVLLVTMLTAALLGYFYGKYAALLVGLLGFIVSVPFMLMAESGRWYCFRCKRYFSKQG